MYYIVGARSALYGAGSILNRGAGSVKAQREVLVQGLEDLNICRGGRNIIHWDEIWLSRESSDEVDK